MMRAVVVVSPNSRVKSATGFVGTVADQPMFPVPPGPSVVGLWLAPDGRTLVGGIPSISSSSTGITISGSTPPSIIGPMTVVQGDARVRST